MNALLRNHNAPVVVSMRCFSSGGQHCSSTVTSVVVIGNGAAMVLLLRAVVVVADVAVLTKTKVLLMR